MNETSVIVLQSITLLLGGRSGCTRLLFWDPEPAAARIAASPALRRRAFGVRHIGRIAACGMRAGWAPCLCKRRPWLAWPARQPKRRTYAARVCIYARTGRRLHNPGCYTGSGRPAWDVRARAWVHVSTTSTSGTFGIEVYMFTVVMDIKNYICINEAPKDTRRC